MPITSEDALREFTARAFGVSVPDVQVCAHHTTPWRAFADAFFARSPVAIWKASRGMGGKSYLLSLLTCVEAAAQGADVVLLGASGAQSKRVLAHMVRHWAYPSAPRSLLASSVSQEIRFSKGNTVSALMASQASVRGPHPQKLRLDEIDEMDLSLLDAALGQPMNARGITAQTVMSSTHQYAQGTMTEMFRRAANAGWQTHEWCYRESNANGTGWLTAEQIELSRATMPARMWQTEVEGQEPSPESRAIDPDAVTRMFSLAPSVQGVENKEHIFEPPQAGARYAHGIDWAKKQDWTIIVTLRVDCNPFRVVAWERTGRLPWPIMIAKANKRCAEYGGAGYHDGTGEGDVVNDHLAAKIIPFLFVGRARVELLNNYIAGIERGEIVSPNIEYMSAEHRYASVDDVFKTGTATGHLPDTFAAGALAYMAAMESRPTRFL